jgi:regulator of sigma E protease
MYIVVAILAFGVLIAVHELGHFTAAKLLGVRVNEFAIGMGPKLLKKQGKETLYTLRALPFGGFCAMGEDDGEPEDDRSFTAQKGWRRITILAAGSVFNLVAGFIIVTVIILLFSQTRSYGGTTIVQLADGFPLEGADGLMAGDRLVSINGERLYYMDDFSILMQIASGKPIDLTVRRGDETIALSGFPLERREYIDDGVAVVRYGITFNSVEATTWEKFKYSCYTTVNFVRLVRLSLAQLFSGAVGVRDLSGPVGIVDAMNDVAQASPNIRAAILNIAHLTAFIGVNLAVMNMLPLPALDGGRILFIFITWALEKIMRRRVDPKY